MKDTNVWLDIFGLHEMIGEIYDVKGGTKIEGTGSSYSSGGIYTGKGSPNQQQALLTHTERKFLDDAKLTARSGNHLKMTDEFNPCKPGCQPAIRSFVAERGVSAEYFASSTKKTYHWESLGDGKVRQTEVFADGKSNIYEYQYNSEGKQIGRRKKIQIQH